MIKKTLQKDAGSLKTKIPTKTVPAAPIPVHTAYAVPIGKLCVAFISNPMLIQSAMTNPAYHTYITFPVVSFAFPRQNAKHTSNSPAIIKIIQFTLQSLRLLLIAGSAVCLKRLRFKHTLCRLRRPKVTPFYSITPVSIIVEMIKILPMATAATGSLLE